MSIGKGIAIGGMWIGFGLWTWAMHAFWWFGAFAVIALTIYIIAKK